MLAGSRGKRGTGTHVLVRIKFFFLVRQVAMFNTVAMISGKTVKKKIDATFHLPVSAREGKEGGGVSVCYDIFVFFFYLGEDIIGSILWAGFSFPHFRAIAQKPCRRAEEKALFPLLCLPFGFFDFFVCLECCMMVLSSSIVCCGVDVLLMASELGPQRLTKGQDMSVEAACRLL